MSIKPNYTNNRLLEKKWSTYTNAVKRATNNKFDDVKAGKLSLLLENTEKAIVGAERRALREATQPTNIGPFKKHAFELITAVMPSLIAEEVVSIQPLQQKIGQIFFLEYQYGSNKGAIKKGDTMFNAFETSPAGYDSVSYSSEQVDQEILAQAGETEITGNFDYIPMRPGTVEITVGDKKVIDDGNGKFTGDATGTIDYATGAYSITLTVAAEDVVNAKYHFDLEQVPSTIPQVDLKISESIVVARSRKLRTLYSFDAAYDLQMSQGLDIDDALFEATTRELAHEIDAEILLDLYRQAGLQSSWNSTYNPTTHHFSEVQHRESFLMEINSAANQIFQSTRRAVGNFVIVGKNAADLIESVGEPRYKPVTDSITTGPHLAGVLDGRIKVYKNPFYAEDEYLVGYKGEQLFEAGYIYAPYLPIVTTDILMLDDFVGRRGYATSYAKRMNNNKLYVKGKIVNS